MRSEYLIRCTVVVIRQAARFIKARWPALPVLLAAGVLLALVTTAGVAAADGEETWAKPLAAAELALPPATLDPPVTASDAPRFQQVSTGQSHTCGVLTDGEVACWGGNEYGQATPPSGTFQQVSASDYYTCGVRTDGAVACWGQEWYGRATPPLGTFQQVSAGDYHACGVRTDGAVVCWGQNVLDEARPPSGTFRQVSSGYDRTCGVRTDGSVACWREDDWGRATPPSGTFQQVSSGKEHTCGVRTSGAVVCWGTYGDEARPPSGTFKQVSAGLRYTCGVRTDGSIACWGQDYFGNATPPSGTFQQVSAGSVHTCGVLTDGEVACWGDDASGEATPPSGTFQQVSAGDEYACGVQTAGAIVCWGEYSFGEDITPPSGTFQQVSAGHEYTCGVRTAGAVVCWGESFYGKASTPPSGNFQEVSAGWGHACGVRTGGAVACWGDDDYGETTPPSGIFQQVSVGWGHTCGVQTSGAVVCWGDDRSGQASPPSGIFQQVSSGYRHTCGVRTSGAVACWGLNDYGQATPPSGIFRQVSAGDDTLSGGYTCGVQTDGTVACWGDDDYGEATPPSGTFRQVSAGDDHTCGVETSGGIVCWGAIARSSVSSGGGTPPSENEDYDADNDGLIEVSNLAQLDAIRYDPDGDGDVGAFQDYVASYTEAFPDAADGMGCPSSGCAGYELTANLDFDTNGNGRADAGDAYWNDGAGWFPIYFSATFDGNGYTISNLYTDHRVAYGYKNGGLFSNIDENGAVKRLGLLAVNITVGTPGQRVSTRFVGGLVGESRGTIDDCYVTGSVTNGGGHTGGLAGSSLGAITGSYADVGVTGNAEEEDSTDYLSFKTGGLVGINSGTISGSYATGNVISNVAGSKAVPEVGGLVGMNFGTISGSYATGKVASNGTGNDHAGSVGGLVGGNGGTITASYATGDVNTNSSARAGGLAGSSPGRTSIIDSYAIGHISGQEDLVGGLVGGLAGRHNSDTFTSSYWDTQTSGLTTSAGGIGKTTAELQSPTSNSGIYRTWDATVWDFGDQDEYPTLRNVGTGDTQPPTPPGDYDTDDDGLIEVSNLAQLDAIRYDLDGDGAVDLSYDSGSYAAAFSNAVANMGCPTAGCVGYELIADLDFDTNGNGRADAGDAYWGGGAGWWPIGEVSVLCVSFVDGGGSCEEVREPFGGAFDGNGYIISNLYIDQPRADGIGLFGVTGASSVVQRVGVVSANIVGNSKVGALIGSNEGGNVRNNYATGSITGRGVSNALDYDSGSTGGLVGLNKGTITASWSTAAVVADKEGGGLVGSNFHGTVARSYAAGSVTVGDRNAGGLVGDQSLGTITDSYSTGNVISNNTYGGAGGLVGGNFGRSSSITNSYSTGTVTGNRHVGGLVGYNGSGTSVIHGTFSGSGTVTTSYWNTETSGLSGSAAGTGKTTAELQAPTGNSGIYRDWDATVWDFGTSRQYPMLRNAGVDDGETPTILLSAPHLYWVDEEAQKIQRIVGEDDAQSVADLAASAQGLTMPGSIALDPLAGKMYWTDDGTPGEPDGAIHRANLDGSNVETLFSGLPDPVGIALDLDAGYLYWADRNLGEIYRVRLRNISNLAAETVVNGLTKPYQIILDTANGHMYWTERGANTSKIRRADLDGQNVANVDFRPYQPQNPFGLALDPIAGKMYWTERSSASTGQDFILSADLDGGNVALVTTSEYHSLSGIAVDVNDGKIYWTDETTGTIRRADPAAADPAQTVEDVVTGLSAPEGIAVARPYQGNTRLALIALYRATDGDNWTNSDGWLSDALPGTWHGVSADKYGLITGLYLNDNNLSGELPSELDTLSHLRILNLSGNRLTGSIPAEWADGLDVLLRLNLSDNQLSGKIPAGLGNHHLSTLNISYNQFEGEIPLELGSLVNLKELNLSYNQLDGEIPSELGSLVNLKELNLSYNQLDGEIPFRLSSLDGLAGCEIIWGIQLTGLTIPMFKAYTGTMTSLEVLDLSGNGLIGVIPPTLCSLTNLEKLNLGHNRLKGTIPGKLGKLTDLQVLRLNGQSPFNNYVFSSHADEDRLANCTDDCYLHGSIPPQLGDLTKLETLDLSDNRLSGSIPPELSYTSHVCFSERYPGPIGSLANLRALDLSDNTLSGKIPVGLCALTALEFLDLGKNFLEGKIPPGLYNLIKMEELNLSNNQLNGSIPAQVVNLPVLSLLSLHGNDFSGCVEITPERAHRLRLIIDDDGVPQTCEVAKALHEKRREYAALQNLYKSTNGNDWTHDSNWQVGVDIYDESIDLDTFAEETFAYGKWHGVQVENVDGEDRIVGLRLNDNNLRGKIPSDLDKDLPYLEYLTLGGNSLEGCVPSDLSLALAVGEGFRDPDTEKLDGEKYEFGLPTELAVSAAEAGTEAAQEKFALDLGAALLVGDTDFEDKKAAQEAFKNAKNDLKRRKNEVGGKIEVVTTITKAVSRVFQSSAIKLNIPVCAEPAPAPTAKSDQEILLAVKKHFVDACEEQTKQTKDECLNANKFGNWKDDRGFNNGPWHEKRWGGATIENGRVTRLDLQRRHLRGTIPAELGGLDQLTHLNLSFNYLTGPIPPELGNLVQLSTLGLNNNRLSNPVITDEDGNRIKGAPIPPELGNLVRLVEFNVQVNELEGWLPLELSMLTSHSLSQMDLDRDGDHVLQGCLPAYTWGNTEAAFALGDLAVDLTTTGLLVLVPPAWPAAAAQGGKAIVTVTKGARFIGLWSKTQKAVRSAKFVKSGKGLVETVKSSRFVKAHPYMVAGAFAGGKAFAEGVQEAMVESALEAYGGPVHSAWSGWVATISNISATEFLRDHLWPGKGAIIMGKVWCGDPDPE